VQILIPVGKFNSASLKQSASGSCTVVEHLPRHLEV
jgi:hypothetical protein